MFCRPLLLLLLMMLLLLLCVYFILFEFRNMLPVIITWDFDCLFCVNIVFRAGWMTASFHSTSRTVLE